MKLPSYFFENTVSVKDVFYFESHFLNTPEPHFFICIGKTPIGVLFFCVSSTQKDKILNRIKIASFPSETMVEIQPTSVENDSPFPDNSYIDCNHVFQYTLEEFRKMYESGKIKIKNQVPLRYYEAIVNGVCLSPNVDHDIIEYLNNMQ